MNDKIAANYDEWLQARKQLLEKEKAHLRAADELAAERRALPKLKLEQDYSFEGPEGKVLLSDLFVGRSQLIVQHFMYSPEMEQGCPSCSFWSDGYDSMVCHLNQRDISFAVVSRGPLEKLLAYKERMGWSFTWVSSQHNSFNYDFHVSATETEKADGVMQYNYRDAQIQMGELHGVSVFEKDSDGNIFHTYSTYGRGVDRLNAAYGCIDLTPQGRNEKGLPWPMAWLKRHDEY
jgi:predicted dithiol-disulfide oxidoreductase (DUF899 family)